MNLIMHEPNIYVNNSKFISIVDNISVFQLPSGPFYTAENLFRVDLILGVQISFRRFLSKIKHLL